MKSINSIAVCVSAVLSFGVVQICAQDGAAETKPSKPNVVRAYRLDFTFNELEGEKKINTRHYSMDLASGDAPMDMKIGTRVPVSTFSTNGKDSGTQWQYVDVGTDLNAQLRPKGDGDDELLVIRSDVSNLDLTAQSGVSSEPVIRQIRINGSTLLVLGKPLLIGSMDDPNSKRQFQLEVTVTKLK